jgi:hypothetical protein
MATWHKDGTMYILDTKNGTAYVESRGRDRVFFVVMDNDGNNAGHGSERTIGEAKQRAAAGLRYLAAPQRGLSGCSCSRKK